MSLRPRSLATRLAVAAAGGAVAVTTLAAAPALASDGGNEHPRVYKGKVTAKSGLLLRDRPMRGSRVVRHEPYGKVVHIHCKIRGGNVHGNNHWYLLTDGTWAWGSAHYISTIGKAPHWC
ncbi:SH3 domain-containing protein [Streptomyces sp. CC224B]|uniref:SH3 domain-containing protein n=1 Tax=Streptomyces sp. CC224B TaxID=3044571 RepID=UPI0024A7E6ED|nr:SH3 domain-containing protein [Streptomyces sp. CC224B]